MYADNLQLSATKFHQVTDSPTLKFGEVDVLCSLRVERRVVNHTCDVCLFKRSFLIEKVCWKSSEVRFSFV